MKARTQEGSDAAEPVRIQPHVSSSALATSTSRILEAGEGVKPGMAASQGL